MSAKQTKNFNTRDYMYSNLQHKIFPNHNSDKTIHHTKTGNINKKKTPIDTTYRVKLQSSLQLVTIYTQPQRIFFIDKYEKLDC